MHEAIRRLVAAAKTVCASVIGGGGDSAGCLLQRKQIVPNGLGLNHRPAGIAHGETSEDARSPAHRHGQAGDRVIGDRRRRRIASPANAANQRGQVGGIAGRPVDRALRVTQQRDDRFPLGLRAVCKVSAPECRAEQRYAPVDPLPIDRKRTILQCCEASEWTTYPNGSRIETPETAVCDAVNGGRRCAFPPCAWRAVS